VIKQQKQKKKEEKKEEKKEVAFVSLATEKNEEEVGTKKVEDKKLATWYESTCSSRWRYINGKWRKLYSTFKYFSCEGTEGDDEEEEDSTSEDNSTSLLNMLAVEDKKEEKVGPHQGNCPKSYQVQVMYCIDIRYREHMKIPRLRKKVVNYQTSVNCHPTFPVEKFKCLYPAPKSDTQFTESNIYSPCYTKATLKSKKREVKQCHRKEADKDKKYTLENVVKRDAKPAVIPTKLSKKEMKAKNMLKFKEILDNKELTYKRFKDYREKRDINILEITPSSDDDDTEAEDTTKDDEEDEENVAEIPEKDLPDAKVKNIQLDMLSGPNRIKEYFTKIPNRLKTRKQSKTSIKGLARNEAKAEDANSNSDSKSDDNDAKSDSDAESDSDSKNDDNDAKSDSDAESDSDSKSDDNDAKSDSNSADNNENSGSDSDSSSNNTDKDSGSDSGNDDKDKKDDDKKEEENLESEEFMKLMMSFDPTVMFVPEDMGERLALLLTEELEVERVYPEFINGTNDSTGILNNLVVDYGERPKDKKGIDIIKKNQWVRKPTFKFDMNITREVGEKTFDYGAKMNIDPMSGLIKVESLQYNSYFLEKEKDRTFEVSHSMFPSVDGVKTYSDYPKEKKINKKANYDTLMDENKAFFSNLASDGRLKCRMNSSKTMTVSMVFENRFATRTQEFDASTTFSLELDVCFNYRVDRQGFNHGEGDSMYLCFKQFNETQIGCVRSNYGTKRLTGRLKGGYSEDKKTYVTPHFTEKYPLHDSKFDQWQPYVGNMDLFFDEPSYEVLLFSPEIKVSSPKSVVSNKVFDRDLILNCHCQGDRSYMIALVKKNAKADESNLDNIKRHCVNGTYSVLNIKDYKHVPDKANSYVKVECSQTYMDYNNTFSFIQMFHGYARFEIITCTDSEGYNCQKFNDEGSEGIISFIRSTGRG